MKAILTDPLVLLLLAMIAGMFGAIAFHTFSQQLRYTLAAEKAAVVFFLIIISGATGITISPLDKFHPRVLSNVYVTPPTMIVQVGAYAIALLLLAPILQYTLKKSLQAWSILLIKAPFLHLFLLWILLSATWSNDPITTLRTSLVIIETAIIAMYIGYRFTWPDLFSILKWFTGALVILAFVYGIGQPSVGRDLDGAWIGINGHKNHFCFLMALSTIIWFINSLYQHKQRHLAAFMAFLALVAMQQGGSGASKVIVICLMALWFYLGTLKTLPTQWAFTSVILFLIISICLVILVTENLEFIVVDTLNKDLTLTGRTDFWPLIIRKINQRPLLGYGIDGFWQPWNSIDNPSRDIIVAKTQFAPPHSHNGFMDLVVDLGYVGLFLFLASMVNALMKAIILLGQEKMPYAGLPLILLTYTILTNLTETGLVGVTGIFCFYVVFLTRNTLDLS